MPKIPTPNLLEVERPDGTFVMDCDCGIALVSVDTSRERTSRVNRTRVDEGRNAAAESERKLVLPGPAKGKPSSN